MEKATEKPKRKIDRSKKKRKLRAKGSFQAALGQKDLRTRSHAASHRRMFGKSDKDEEIIQLPENDTYEMPTTSEESSCEDEYSEEETKLSDKDEIVDTKSLLESIEHEKEYFGEKRPKNINDKTANSRVAEKSEMSVEQDDENLDNLDNLLTLSEPSNTSVTKSLKFTPTVSKSKWKNSDKKISELEMYLDSVLDL